MGKFPLLVITIHIAMVIFELNFNSRELTKFTWKPFDKLLNIIYLRWRDSYLMSESMMIRVFDLQSSLSRSTANFTSQLTSFKYSFFLSSSILPLNSFSSFECRFFSSIIFSHSSFSTCLHTPHIIWSVLQLQQWWWRRRLLQAMMTSRREEKKNLVMLVPTFWAENNELLSVFEALFRKEFSRTIIIKRRVRERTSLCYVCLLLLYLLL